MRQLTDFDKDLRITEDCVVDEDTGIAYWDYAICGHGVYKGYVGVYCKECDKEEEQHGGIDKCMNCGGYKWSDSLTYPDQVCKKGCVNPNEY